MSSQDKRMAFEPRISVVTLGVSDVRRSTAFYEALGFVRSEASSDAISFFAVNGGMVLALFERSALADDAKIPRPDDGQSGFHGFTLAYNTRSACEVDTGTVSFVAAGGRLVKAPERTFWGGYSGYVADPDDHIWEIAFNPHWSIDEVGRVALHQAT